MSYLIYKLTQRYLPKHFFIYIFACCFIGGAAALLISRLIGMGILLLAGVYTIDSIINHHLTILSIMLFPEAF